MREIVFKIMKKLIFQLSSIAEAQKIIMKYIINHNRESNLVGLAFKTNIRNPSTKSIHKTNPCSATHTTEHSRETVLSHSFNNHELIVFLFHRDGMRECIELTFV